MKSNLNEWEKIGLIYSPVGDHDFDYSHCHKPIPIQIDASTIRVFFGARCKAGKLERHLWTSIQTISLM